MACSGDGKPAQLAALPGHPTKQIRKTDDTPPRIAAIDVASATTGKHARNTTRYILVVQEKPRSVSNIEQLPLSSVACAIASTSVWPMHG